VSPITPVYDLPYPAPTDPADVPADMGDLAGLLDVVINGIDSRLATVEATATTRPPVVTALPGAPVTGQEIYFKPDAAQPWILWHLRYNGASASAFKWEAVGSQVPLSAVDATSRALTGSATYNLGPAELSIVCPLAGEYFAEGKADISSTTGVAKYIKMDNAVGGTDDTYASTHSLGNLICLNAVNPRVAVAAAGGKVYLLFRQGTAESGTWIRRQCLVRPIRVG
jgi:hypothetical protein